MPIDEPPPLRPDLASLETPRELAAEAEWCEARARYLRALAASLEAQAVVLRRREGLARTGELPKTLRAHDTFDTVNRMNVDTRGKPESVKRGAARATRRHKAQRKLYEAGVSLTDVAKELGEGRPRVSSWFAPGDTNRPIPRKCAEYLRDKYGVPLEDWRRIGD